MNRRNRCVILVALALAVAATPPTDLGPPQSVAAIRTDVPKLLANRMGGDGSVSVTDVVADATRAVAIWQGGGNVGIAVLQKRNARWWLMAYALHPLKRNEWTDLKTTAPTNLYCGSGENPAPAADVLTKRFAIPPSVAQSAAASYAESTPASPMAIATSPRGTLVRGRWVDCATYPVPYAAVDGYVLDLAGMFTREAMPALTASNATPESETSIARLVHVTISSSEPLPPSTLNVWCPWPLDPTSRYTLTLRLTNGREQRIAGSLDNANNLHFVLPPIPIVPLAVTRGTISVDPPAIATSTNGR